MTVPRAKKRRSFGSPCTHGRRQPGQMGYRRMIGVSEFPCQNLNKLMMDFSRGRIKYK